MDNVLQQLIYQLNTQDYANADKEKVFASLIKDLETIDFSDAENRKAGENFISNILNVKIGRNNDQITDFQAVAMHYIVTKCAILDQGLRVDKINYSYKPKDSWGAAFYRDQDKSINFYFDNICHKRYFIEPYAKEKEGDYGAKGRLGYFLRQIMELNHELRHVQQFAGFHNAKNVDDLTPELFLMMNESCAREFSLVRGSKYQKKTNDKLQNADRLYHENHDEFLFEIDANRAGYEQALKFMKRLCPKGYEVALGKNEKYMEKITDLTKKMHDYQQIMWQHDTNPNQAGVRADHKAVLVIDSIIPMMSGADKKFYFEQYPSILLTHQENGKRKSLEEVENDRKRKIEELLSNYDGKDKDAKLANLSRLYESAIEGDPILSLENCLRHIAKLSFDSDRYFTQSGSEIRYSNKHLFQEIKMTEQKARALISYIEEADRKVVDALLLKYKKEAMKGTIKGFSQQHLMESKKNAFIDLEFAARKNTTLEEDRKQERENNFKKKQKLDSAKELLQKVYPQLKLQPYEFIAGEDGQIRRVDNEKEKFLLMQSYNKLFASSYMSPKVMKVLRENGIAYMSEIKEAINTVYPFDISKQANEDFCNLEELGDIAPFKSVFETTDQQKQHQNVQVKNDTKGKEL